MSLELSLRAYLGVLFVLQLQAPIQQSDSLRDSFSRVLREVVSARSDRERDARLLTARRLAVSYSVTWKDDFLVRQAERFARASIETRKHLVAADSLRRSGITALQSQGINKAMSLWRESMRHAVEANDDAAKASARVSLGGGFYRMGQLDSATSYLTAAEREAERIGDNRTTGNAIGILATIYKDRGDLERALAMYRRASAVRIKSGDTRGLAADANNIGAIAQQKGDLDAASIQYDRALSLNRRDKRYALAALNLDNLAGIASTRGDYSRSESLYREALSLNQQANARADAAFLWHGLGKLYIERGDYARAVQALGESIRIHDSSGAVSEAIEARAELAEVKTAMGSLDEARAILTRASNDARSASTPAGTRALLALSRGDLAVEFGTFAEASTEYGSALSFYRSAEDSAGIARATEAIALLMHERGDNASASRLMHDAASIRRKSGDRRSAAMTNLILAEMLIANDDFSAAKTNVQSAFATFRGLGDPVGEAASLALSGDIFRHSGMLDSAAYMYRRGLKRIAGRNAADVEWRLHTDLGRTLHRTGDLTAAASELRAAIAIAERTAAAVRLEERRAGFNSDKWIAYRELALVELDRRRPGDAFAVSERLRARQMVDLLARGRIPFPGESTREQDTRRKIARLTRELEKSTDDYPRAREPRLDPRPASDIRAELNRTQREYATQLATMRETSPAYARLVSGTTRTWRDIAARLKPDQVLLEYLLTDSVSVVFVVTTDGVTAVDLHTPQDQIASLVEFSRRTIEQSSGRGTQNLWKVPLRRLYSALIEPVESKGYLRGRKTLLITPHSELHLLSFAALIDPRSGKYLVDRFEISYAPSATVWAQLKDRPNRPSPSGVLAMAPNIRSLPGTRDEVNRIARIYGSRATVRTGSAATPQELRSRLASSGTVHLATFGVLNRHNPLFSFIELAPDARGDGHLTVSEVFGLPMSGQLVVLSACQTAVGSGSLADVPPGDDWIGLVQAFLQAGANAVLASLWPVDDRASADLMTQFHRERVNGASAATAIARAQRVMLRNKNTADPFYWAAFAAVGRAE